MRKIGQALLSGALLLLMSILAPICTRAAEYHLTVTGNDADAGTAEAPFRTMRKGISVLTPGDTLYVKNGTYKGIIEYGAFRSGSSWEQPVKVAAYPGHRPVIVPPGDGEACLYFVDTKYFILDGFVLDSAPNGQGVGITWGTGFPQAHHIELRNCEIKNSKGQGILTGGDGCRFINLDVHDNGTDGLTHGIYLNGDRNLIDGGRYYRNVGWGIHVYPNATNTTVRNVRCFENGATGLGLVWGSNNVAYNNLVYRNGSGIHLSGDSPRCYNNTVYGNRGEGLSVANAGNGPRGTRNTNVRNNIVFKNESGIADYATGTGTILSNNFTNDPKFVNAASDDFRLRDDSPAIDQGADLRGQGVTTDIEGGPRPQGKAFDIGAYEFPPRASASGPLRVHPDNSRYFTDGSGKAIYLTGSHHWDNLRDRDGSAFDYVGYLDFMQAHHHNFIRLWAWEQVHKVSGTGTDPDNSCFTPPVYPRPGPGKAIDGGPKVDLGRLNQGYFDRLRSRVVAARDRGIYVSIMLFQGWDIESHGADHENPWPAHPFHRDNNLNGIDGDPDEDNAGKETHTLKIPAITRLQEAYVRKVIDTVNDLDNVLYEITNEDYASEENTSWQYHMIEFIHRYEKGKAKQHPVGMTVQGEGKDSTLFDSPADWISPGGQDYRDEPPPATGAKVILNDTDHLWGVGGDHRWVWKCFLQGLNPIYMDPLPGSPQKPWMSNTEQERRSARRAMGDARRYAEKINLVATAPHPELASTRCCLSNPGTEYLIYQPKGGEGFSVELRAGTYSYKWFNVAKGQIADSGNVQAAGGKHQFKAPFTGDAVLYLKARER